MLTKEARKFVERGLELCHKITMSMMEHYQEHHWIDEDGKKIEVKLLEDLDDEEWGKSGDHVSAFHHMMKANVVQIKGAGVKAYREVKDLVIDNIALCFYFLRHGEGDVTSDDAKYIEAVNEGRDMLEATKDNKDLGWHIFKAVVKALVLTIPRYERGDFKEEAK